MAITTYNPQQPDSIGQLIQIAEMLAQSTIIPRAYHRKPNDIVAAGMLGADFGWSPITAMRLVHVVDGKPTVSAEGMVALARAAGHSITGETSATAATVTGTRSDTGDTMSASFTMQDAQRAGLGGRGPWKAYPEAMLWARAVSNLCRRLFPDVTLGLYVEGELDPPAPQPDSRPAAVEVLNADTGTISDIRQPPPYETVGETAAALIVERYSQIVDDGLRDKIVGWLASFDTGFVDECEMVEADIALLPAEVGEKLSGLIGRALSLGGEEDE